MDSRSGNDGAGRAAHWQQQIYDAAVRPDITMRQVGPTSTEISQRCDHPMKQAHLAAAEQVAALVCGAGGGS